MVQMWKPADVESTRARLGAMVRIWAKKQGLV